MLDYFMEKIFKHVDIVQLAMPEFQNVAYSYVFI